MILCCVPDEEYGSLLSMRRMILYGVSDDCFSTFAPIIVSRPFVRKLIFYHFSVPASVAQLNARPTGDLGVAGSTPAEVGNIHEIFFTVNISLPLIQEGQLSVSCERMCTILVNRLED